VSDGKAHVGGLDTVAIRYMGQGSVAHVVSRVMLPCSMAEPALVGVTGALHLCTRDARDRPDREEATLMEI
jgi:hypothetical protein